MPGQRRLAGRQHAVGEHRDGHRPHVLRQDVVTARQRGVGAGRAPQVQARSRRRAQPQQPVVAGGGDDVPHPGGVVQVIAVREELESREVLRRELVGIGEQPEADDLVGVVGVDVDEGGAAAPRRRPSAGRTGRRR